jgi:hypothetical protein
MFRLIQKDSGEGIVCAVGKDQVLVAPADPNLGAGTPPPSALSVQSAKSKNSCGTANCGSCGGCPSLISTPDGYVGKFSIPVNNPNSFKLGDRVRFDRFIPEPNLMSALVFGVPVAFAVAAMMYWAVAAPQSAESTVAVISVIAAFFAGIIILAILDKIFKTKYPATIANINACGHNDSAEGK